MRHSHQTSRGQARSAGQLPNSSKPEGEATAHTYLVQYVAFNDFKPSLSTDSSPHLLYVHYFFKSFAIKLLQMYRVQQFQPEACSPKLQPQICHGGRHTLHIRTTSSFCKYLKDLYIYFPSLHNQLILDTRKSGN